MLPLPVLIVALGLLSAATVSAEPPCGGALDGDFGSFHFYDSEDSDSYNQFCVFVIRLHSTTNLSVTASEVAAGTSVGVFTSELALTPSPVVPPLFVFNQSTQGSTFRTRFSTMILVLNPSSTNRDFKVQWRGEAPGTGLAPIETANYIDADSGTVEQDDYGLAVLALVLNPSQGDRVDLSIKVLGYEEQCTNVTYSVFVPQLGGNLREVIRSCGVLANQTSLPTPLIALIAKPALQQSEIISFHWQTTNVPEEATTSCGGSLQANQGVLQYEDDETADPSHACAWSLRLQSKSGFRLTLLDLNDEGGVGIFSSAQAGSTSPTIEPAYPLNVSDIGRPLDPIGEILIVILNPSTSRRRFAVSWDGLEEAPAGSPESLTYLDSNEGALTQHDSFLTLAAFILNPPSAWNLNVEVEVLDFEGLCADVAFSTFQVTPVGNLREVLRTCGQPTRIPNIPPPLISFVAKAKQDQAETIRLAWSSLRPPTTDGPPPTPDPTLVVSTECGGTLVGSRGVIRYKIQTPYVRDERCVWTIRANLFSQVRLQLVDDGLYTVPGFDYLTISTVPNMDVEQLVSTDQIVNGGFRSPFSVRGPVVFVSFRTARGGPRGFELSFDGEGSNVPNRLFTHLHFNTSLDSNNEFRYPASGNYRDSEFVTLVFNQGLLNLQYRLGLRFDYIDLESQDAGCPWDVLSIHEASPAANVDHLERICPTSSSTVKTFTSVLDGGTFIVLFKTDNSVVRTGFRGSYSYLRV